MRQSITELSAEFERFRSEIPLSARGKRKKIIYPERLRAKATALYRSTEDLPVHHLAKQLGVSQSGFLKWLKHAPKAEPAAMIPVKVLEQATKPAAPHKEASFGGESITLISRKVEIKLPSAADAAMIAAVLQSLNMGGEPC